MTTPQTQTQALQCNRGGKRAKKMANHSAVRDSATVIKDEGQEYGKVTKVLGNCRFTIMCYDGKERLGIMRGKNCKGKGKFNNLTGVDDHVLVGLRDFEKDKCDIILKYTHNQHKDLIKRGELPQGSAPTGKLGEDEDDETGFDFDDI